MTDYLCTARTNYVKVKDPEEWDRLVMLLGGEVIGQTVVRTDAEAEESPFERLVGAVWNDGYGVFIPFDDDEPNPFAGMDDVESVFRQVLAMQLVPGEVLIYQESGYEGSRYVVGYALAVNATGEAVDVSLNDIYAKARELTSKPDGITPAEY